MHDLRDQLEDLELRFWHGDGDFYRSNLVEDCRMALPGMGLIDRATAISGIDGAARWDMVEMLDVRVQSLGRTATILSYRARARRDGDDYEAVISSVYVLVANAWRMAFHHQSAR